VDLAGDSLGLHTALMRQLCLLNNDGVTLLEDSRKMHQELTFLYVDLLLALAERPCDLT